MKSWNSNSWLMFQIPIWFVGAGIAFCALSSLVGVPLIVIGLGSFVYFRRVAYMMRVNAERRAQQGDADADADALAHELLQKHGLLLDTNDPHDPKSLGWVDSRSKRDGGDDWCGAA